MRLQNPPLAYSYQDQVNLRAAIREADEANQKQDAAIIRTSPNGTRWVLGVSDAGTTTWTAL